MVDSRRVTVALERPIASRSLAKDSMSARRTANRASERNPAPAGELAQVQGIGLAGQAAVPGQEPGERDPLGVGEDGLDRGEHGGWGGSGHRAPPGQAGTGEARPVPAPAVKRKPTVDRPARSRDATKEREA